MRKEENVFSSHRTADCEGSVFYFLYFWDSFVDQDGLELRDLLGICLLSTGINDGVTLLSLEEMLKKLFFFLTISRSSSWPQVYCIGRVWAWPPILVPVPPQQAYATMAGSDFVCATQALYQWATVTTPICLVFRCGLSVLIRLALNPRSCL